jgi:predicted RNase H-like HicB family nuclease
MLLEGEGSGPVRTRVAPGWAAGTILFVDRVVHVPYTVEQDETGWWAAHASLPGGGANGEGQTAEEAVADLREALDGWFAEFGVPDELTITVRDVA